ncbi:MAG: carbon-nitrogen hydrolase family protein [Fimbriimonadia bacterium]|jgi:predicted amidohydrolase
MPELLVASVQFAPAYADVENNLSRVIALLRDAAGRGAKLVVFPECALTGYGFPDRETALNHAMAADGPEVRSLAGECARLGVCAAIGFTERGDPGLFNSAALLGPDGLLGVYRKTHLPWIGLDRFADKGSALPVFDTPFGRFGILICYDLRFPEAGVSLALRGADAILVPTNWPEGAESSPHFLAPARANENRLYVIASNRVGEEAGFRFIGKSGIWGFDGKPIAFADHADETILTATIDPEKARQKRVIVKPGEFESEPLADRRPELYDLQSLRRPPSNAE